MITVPYINLPSSRPRRVVPPQMDMPNEDMDAAAAAYQIPSYSRPQVEDPRTSAIAQQVGIPTDLDIPRLNLGSTDESLPVRPSREIPSFALPARDSVPISTESLDIKRAAGDFSSAPGMSDIKTASGVPAQSPDSLPSRSAPVEIPRFALPAQSPGDSASPPPGVTGNVPTSPYFTPQPPPRTPGSGWKARLGAIGRGALYGFGMGGQQGGMGAIGGTLAGAITGGVSPKTIARWETEGDQAKWRQTHALEEQDATREANRQNLSHDNALADREAATRAAAQTTNEKYRTDAQTETKLQHREEAAKNHVNLIKQFGGTVDTKAVAGTSQESFGGRTYQAPPKSPLSEYSQTHTGTDGNLYGLRKDTGRMEMVKDKNGQPFKPYQRPERDPTALTPGEKQRAEREAETDYNAAVKAAKASDTKTVGAKQELSRRIQSAIHPAQKGVKAMTQAEVDANPYFQSLKDEIDQHEANSRSAWQAVGGHVDRLEHEFGWRANRQNLDYPSATRELTRSSASKSSSSPRSGSSSYPPLTKQSKVGGTYMHNGQVVRVRSNNDGKFQLDQQ